MTSRHLTAITLLLLFAYGTHAAWEDTGVPATPQPAPRYTTTPRTTAPRRAVTPQQQPRQAPYHQPAPQRQPATYRQPAPQRPAPPPQQQQQQQQQFGTTRGFVPPDLYSPFLDARTEPRRWAYLTYVPGAETDRTPDGEEVSLLEFDTRINLAQWRNVLLGDMDVNIRLKSLIFIDDANLTVMPTGLLELPLQVDWTWRYLNGLSFQIGARPGFYADAEALGEGLAVPFHTAFYYAVNPHFSWLLGAEVRLDWNMPVMPLVGLGWEPSEFFRLILALPTTTAVLQLGPVGIFGTAGWRTTTYGMSGEDGDPEQLTVEDIKLGGGVQIAFGENFNMRLEGGLLVNRSLIAETGDVEDTLDLDEAPYFSVAFGGSF